MPQKTLTDRVWTPVLTILGNRSFAGLLLANTILGMAFPIQLVLGGLAGLMLAPSANLATLPSSVQTLAALIAAAPFSLLMGHVGRRAGFVLGGALTLFGALAAVKAINLGSFALLCVAHFLMGAGWSSFQYFRFAAGEVVAARLRPIAISLMLTSFLVAALAGPQIFIAAKDALSPVPFAGAYAALALVALVGVLPLVFVRIPLPSKTSGLGVFSHLAALRRPVVRRAVSIAAVSQGVMVFLMIPTPIAMVGCGFDERTAGDVIRWHIVAMFAPSFFTGFLIQQFGALRIANSGLIIIMASAALAAIGVSAVHFYSALIVLGLGWNLSFIGATTMLATAVSEAEKAAVQGANDTLIAFVSTLCAFAAGFVVTGFGWSVLAVLSGSIVGVTAVFLIFDRAVLAKKQ